MWHLPNSSSYKVHLNHILWRLGLRHILPRDIINAIPILDNGENIVPIVTGDRIITKTTEPFYLRIGAYKKLEAAVQSLPPHLCLKIFDAWRSPERQQLQFNAALEQMLANNPGISHEQAERKARLVSASLTNGSGPHQTGGALDITLCYLNGQELDMGCPYMDHTPRCQMFFPNLTKAQKDNRLLLRTIMQNAGFSLYPGEWWHYSYGDRSWAAYSGRKIAIYGPCVP